MTAWRWFITVVPVLVVVVIVTIVGREPSTAATSNLVVVTIPPLAGIVHELVPDAEVRVLLPPGASPHHPTLRPSDRQSLTEAAVVVAIGAGFDDWAGLPEDRTYSVMAHLDPHALITINADDQHDHDHHHHHHHSAYDPHVWLDPALMADALSSLATALEPVDSQAPMRAKQCAAELRALSSELTQVLQPHAERAVIQHHDSLRYLLRRGGLRPLGLLFDNNVEEQGAQHQHALIKRARDERAIIVSEPQLDPRPAKLLAQESGRPLVVIDPLATPVGTGGYATWLRHLCRDLAEACDVD